jgi:hypothetical protein
VTPADLEAMLAADLADTATRLILADALTDLFREPEAVLCRDLERPIRAADFGTEYEGEPPLGRRVVDFDHTCIEWLPDDSQEVRHVRGPWETSPLEAKAHRSETRFMLWYRAGEGRPGRSREGWDTSVLYVREPFIMTELHVGLFRNAVREHAVGCMTSTGRMWAIQWPDGIIEQEPQELALVQR